ncbi:MAG: hypothetical protein AB7I59_30305 [Geminicoccaceae bacterium]
MQALIIGGAVSKGLRGFNRRFWNNRRATLAAFKAMLRDPNGRDIFDSGWFTAVTAQVQRQRSILLKIIAASLVPTGFLALFLLDIRAEIDVLGFKVDDRATIFEIALLATCLLGLYGARVAISIAQAEQLQRAWLNHRYGRRSAQLYHFALDPPPFCPPPFVNPPNNRLTPTVSGKGVRLAAQTAFYAVAGIVGLAAAGTQIWAVVWAITRGGQSVCIATEHLCRLNPSPNLWIVSFCAATTVLNFIAYATYGIPQRYDVR